ncbi:hypothetical protein C8Q78DRAFT_1106137 [Trametes maxima]|nr:hypothetical protein C8Q78DRAFT_1106137 [Trametes maxima]
MSQAESLEHLWPVLRDADVSFFLSCVATALAFYEHLITIRLEVQQVWKRDASGATLLIVMTRYLMLLNRIFAIISLYPVRELGVSLLPPYPSIRREFTDCFAQSTVLWLQTITASALMTVLAAIGAIRVYALWNRDIRLLVVVFLTGILPAFANLFFRGASSAYVVPIRFYTCQSAPTAMTAQTYKTCARPVVALATRVVAIFSDGLVVILTFKKTFKVYTITRRIRLRGDYSSLILRDGAVYFLAICMLNLAAIVFITMTGTNLLNDLIVTLSAIMMARFLLNLRDHRARLEDASFDLGSTTKLTSSTARTSLRFQPGMLDTMGGSLGMGSRGDGMDGDDVEDEDEEMDGDGSEEETCVDSLEDLRELKKVPYGAGQWA